MISGKLMILIIIATVIVHLFTKTFSHGFRQKKTQLKSAEEGKIIYLW